MEWLKKQIETQSVTVVSALLFSQSFILISVSNLFSQFTTILPFDHQVCVVTHWIPSPKNELLWGCLVREKRGKKKKKKKLTNPLRIYLSRLERS